jgi:hypothetical protein
VRDFHSRCDGHAKTLTILLDTNGKMLGVFTLVKWESRMPNKKVRDERNCWKAERVEACVES